MKNTHYINIRKFLVLVCVALFTTACGQTLKNSWSNFRAYYNTYYNAEKNFRAGLEKVQSQPFEIDPREPVRIHRAPNQAGNSDFAKAIDKGAKILRRFPRSKWVDDALLLIGKSYYYRGEFYPALKKFEELRSATDLPAMQQRAIIWKARTFLDLKRYREGVRFLQQELQGYPGSWSMERKGEIQALLGEHLAMLQNWAQAEGVLSSAVLFINKRELLGRTYFLHGQVLERWKRYSEAYVSFTRVTENFPGFEYTFWAQMKQADVARKDGNMKLALAIYNEMRKDDKNFERIEQLKFEIARTLEMKGEVGEAEKRYKQLLNEEDRGNTRKLKGKIYFRLGKIYSESYSNFGKAAAYFDSSATYNNKQRSIEQPVDVKSLADAFNEYNRYKNKVHRADSLLRLGELSSLELDSVLDDIRRKKRRALLAEKNSSSKNRLINKNAVHGEDKTTKSSIYGFLNHRNPELVVRGRAEFRLIWGDRPLVDNWRRIEAIESSSANNDRQHGAQRGGRAQVKETKKTVIPDMNIEAIPRTSEEKKKIRMEKLRAQYQLGNLLFLNLDRPDNARSYFYKVIHSEADTDLRPRAVYSLYELFKAENNPDSVRKWREHILREYPGSKYARRIRGGAGKPGTTVTFTADSVNLKQQYEDIVSSDSAGKPAGLRQLALRNRSAELAPYIHYQAIEGYIRRAREHRKKSDSLFADMMTITDWDTLHVTKIVSDSVQGDAVDKMEFNSVYWDSVRMVLQEFDTTFTDARQHSKVSKLRALLEKYSGNRNRALPTCTERGLILTVTPSLGDFLSSVSYPGKLNNRSISGELTYTFVVTEEGKVESYQLQSGKTTSGIEKAFERAIEKSLQFKPFKSDDIPEKLRCTYTFPIQRK